jgi:hypothetical protein
LRLSPAAVAAGTVAVPGSRDCSATCSMLMGFSE